MELFELGKKYTIQEVKSILQLSNYAWDRRRKDVMEHMERFFDFHLEIGEKGREYFVFEKEYGDYEPIKRKNNSSTKKRDNSAKFDKLAEKEIKQHPYNNGSNLGRRVVKHLGNPCNHSIKTAGNYGREFLKEKCEKMEYTWCKFNAEEDIYEPVLKEQAEFLKDKFMKIFSSKEFYEKITNMIAEIEEGEISKNEVLNYVKSSCYNGVLNEFVSIYGFIPRKIPFQKLALSFKK